MNQISLSVPGISCGHCKQSIEGAVSALDGVNTVDVQIDSRLVDVAFDDPLELDQIIETIEDQGYEVARS